MKQFFLENLIFPQKVKKFPTFHEACSFITLFITVGYMFPSPARCIQSTPPNLISFRSFHPRHVSKSCLYLGLPSKPLSGWRETLIKQLHKYLTKMAVDPLPVLSRKTRKSWTKILTLMTRPAICFPRSVRLNGKLSVVCPQIKSGEMWPDRTDMWITNVSRLTRQNVQHCRNSGVPPNLILNKYVLLCLRPHSHYRPSRAELNLTGPSWTGSSKWLFALQAQPTRTENIAADISELRGCQTRCMYFY